MLIGSIDAVVVIFFAVFQNNRVYYDNQGASTVGGGNGVVNGYQPVKLSKSYKPPPQRLDFNCIIQ
jgi:hypothetical protein